MYVTMLVWELFVFEFYYYCYYYLIKKIYIFLLIVSLIHIHSVFDSLIPTTRIGACGPSIIIVVVIIIDVDFIIYYKIYLCPKILKYECFTFTLSFLNFWLVFKFLKMIVKSKVIQHELDFKILDQGSCDWVV